MQNLDSRFWSRFSKTTWEKKSVVIEDIKSPLLQMDQHVIFTLLVAYSERCRRLKSAEGIKFYLQGHRQFESEALRNLPMKSDLNFEGYHNRMASQYDDYCLVCDELLQINSAQQDKLENFTSLLFSTVGLPNRFAEMGLYLGNYRKTPFGVHEDACGVFSFPVVGKKKFRIWQPAYIKKNPRLVRAFSYAKHKAASQVLEVGVGDMAYWPSSAWHIAESNGAFSVTWSLGVWLDKKQSDVVCEVTGELFKNALGLLGEARAVALPENNSDETTAEVVSLPHAHVKALAALQSLTAGQIEAAFRESWMKHLSMQGLKTHPRSQLVIKPKMLFRLKSAQRRIRWMRDGSSVIYAFNGATLRSSSKSIFKFITALNQGRTLRTRRDFKVLQPFAQAGAFAAVDCSSNHKKNLGPLFCSPI
jgi:hypothetical protein